MMELYKDILGVIVYPVISSGPHMMKASSSVTCLKAFKKLDMSVRNVNGVLI